jgi:WD40 repeat protein
MPAVLVRLAILLSALTTASAPAQPRLDQLGDPLPPGALFRIGTTRLQLPRSARIIVASADGRRLAAFDGSVLAVWELPGGREVFRTRIVSSIPTVLAFSTDGKKLAVNGYDNLVLLDAASGEWIISFPGVVNAAAFTPDGKSLVAARRDEPREVIVTRWDLATRAAAERWRIEGDPALTKDARADLYSLQLCLSADGKRLGTLEGHRTDGRQLIRLHDPATGAEVRRWLVDGSRLYHLDFSPDGRALMAVSAWHADAEDAKGEVCAWDAATGKELRRLKLAGGLHVGRFWQAVAEGALYTTETAGVCRYDLPTGKLLHTYPHLTGPFGFVGKQTLAVQDSWHSIHLLDIASGKEVCPLPRAGPQVALTGDGRHIAWSDGGEVVLAALPDGKEVRRWPAHGRHVVPLAFAPDGQTLASAGSDGRIRVWAVATGRERYAMDGTYSTRLAVDAGGRFLLSDSFAAARSWELASGQWLGTWSGLIAFVPSRSLIAVLDGRGRRLQLIDPATHQVVQRLAGCSPHVDYQFRGPSISRVHHRDFSPIISPDGRLVLAGFDRGEPTPESCPIALWDVATGQRLPHTLEGQDFVLRYPAFSPDATLLALTRCNGTQCLWSTAAGQVVRTLGVADDEPSTPPVFTPDGRLVVTVVRRRVQCWEVATGGEIARRDAHPDDVRELTMSADGRLLATGSADGTTLVWDLSRLLTEAGAPFPEPNTLWQDLASAEAARARRAVESLIGAPAEALALLQKRLPPAPVPDAKRLARCIGELDDDEFARRERAEDEVEQIGGTAVPALQKALLAAPPLEARRRIERLLKKLDPTAVPSAEALRDVRAVQVLEMLATPEARNLLDALARGAPGARRTREAQGALDRRSRSTAPGQR